MGSTRTPRQILRARPQLEQLENRLMPAGIQPTATAQLLLEQLNDARSNPALYGQSIGLDLAGVAPSQPLSWDPRLIASALGHSQDMNANNYFGHTNPSGQSPGTRMAYQGFAYDSWGESIAAGFTSTAEALKGLIIDAGIADLGHRRHLLAIDAAYKSQSQVGIGIVMNGSGQYSNYYTIDTAAPLAGGRFLTGAVFNDTNGNNRYDIGEGLGGVTVTVQGVGSITSFDTGGYQLQVPSGTYTVTASGGGLSAPISQTVTVGALNLRLQIIQRGGTSGTSSTSNTTQPSTTNQHAANVVFVNQLFQAYLKRTPTTSEASTFVSQLDNGQATSDSLTRQIKARQEYRTVCTTWLRQVYRDLLGRDMGNSEIPGWLSYLQGSGTMDSAVDLILKSQEFRQRQWAGWVQDVYQTYLRRGAGSGEVTSWIGNFQAGWTKDSFVAAVAASAEYQNRMGQSNSQFVAALYGDLLGRSASYSEIAMWVSGLNNGGNRSGIVAGFVASYEYRRRQYGQWSTQLYGSWLGRPAGASEVSALVNALSAGVSYDAIEDGVLNSLEYYNRAAGR